MKKPRVYSYLRFSDPRQAAGGSADRQMDYARKWAAEHDSELDTALSMRDEGLSAYHQAHIKRGALGVFLQAVEDGKIPTGSVLIVEGLDRLSRAEPIQAQAQLAQIINAGITVVTASDGREYNRATLKAQPMDLVYSLLVMIRAHEESETKSRRVKAAIERQCKGWIAGTYRGIIRNGTDPQWVEWDGGKWQIIEDRAQAARMALQLFTEGFGAQLIIRKLTDAGLQLTASGSNNTYIYKLVTNAALMGVKTITTSGETYALRDYYPALLSETEFAELQLLKQKRTHRSGVSAAAEIPSILTGMGITLCGYCGSALAAQNCTARRKADGQLNDGHRRIACSSYNTAKTCPTQSTNSIAPIERAILRWCSDQINLDSINNNQHLSAALRTRQVKAHAAMQEIEQQLNRLTDAILSDDSGAPPQVLVRKSRELEQKLQLARAETEAIEREIHTIRAPDQAQAAAQWAELSQAALALDFDARVKVRKLIGQTFSRIVIYLRGVEADPDSKHLDMVISGKSGITKLLRIHRKSGATLWVEDAVGY